MTNTGIPVQQNSTTRQVINSIDTNRKSEKPEGWITQAEAARIRGVSQQAIDNLVKRNRFKTLNLGGKTLLNRIDVANYRPKPPGPRSSKKCSEAESTRLQDRRRSDAQQNKYLINKSGNDQDLQKYISQAEAARIRGVSYQAITDLIKRGRLSTAIVAGRPVVLRAEVENFVAQPKLGRPARKTISKKSTQGK
jgi:predicted DNA-binding protein (UPF0251 family)